jgi:hypothetical protein
MQTNCISFDRIKSKKVLADFSGGHITSDAGVMLLRAVNQRTGFLDKFADALGDHRHPSYVEHSIPSMIKQRVLGICCGYEDGNDHLELRKDPLFVAAAGLDPVDRVLASPATLCRLENSVDRAALARIAIAFVEQFIASFKKNPGELILDFDATDDRVHGCQEQAHFHGYYRDYCFLPLYVFCGDRLVTSYLRPSNIDAAKHAWAILALLVKRFRWEWPGVKIRFRADSGFCRQPLLNWCDRNDVEYLVGLARNSRLYAAARPIIRNSQKKRERTKKKVRDFGEIRYAALSWTKKRRVIVKAEQLDLGENIRYLVTNIVGEAPGELYDGCYVERGEMENRIKEQQLHLFADRTSCHRFLANQFRLFLSSAAYVLMEEVRRLALKGTELARAQCETIRNKLIKIGAIVIANTRSVRIKMSEYHPCQEIFRIAALRLT